jgi:hypothetical protein
VITKWLCLPLLASFCFAQRRFTASAILARLSGNRFRFFVADLSSTGISPLPLAELREEPPLFLKPQGTDVPAAGAQPPH